GSKPGYDVFDGERGGGAGGEPTNIGESMTDASHQGLILDQFTRQASLFSSAVPITNADALRMIVEAARPAPGDNVLDVACGGGIVVCAFAPHVRQATGIDVTPA